jgi:hypothetical protein
MARLDPESRKRGVSLYVSRSRTRVLLRGVRWPDGDRERAERWERRLDPATARRFARELNEAADAVDPGGAA